MYSAQQDPEGKAWWVQLQHERAVTAGCQFYTFRPATSSTSTCLQHQEFTLAGQHSKPSTMARPSTVDNCRPLAYTSSTFSAGEKAAAGPVPSPFVMRPATSPKLPARKALGSRQGGAIHPWLTAVSRPVPMSRGNDWSPLHSRLATRDTAHALTDFKPSAEMCCILTLSAAENVAAGVAGERVKPATKHAAKPPLPYSKQQRPRTTTSLHRPSSLWQEASSSSMASQDAVATAEATPVQAQASTAQAQGGDSGHEDGSQQSSGKAIRPKAAVLINYEERVRVVPMLHPGQRQHKQALLKAAIQDRFEAWAPLTEAQFIAYTPRRMQEEQDAAHAQEREVALRPAHFALPVPPHRGQQRVVMHDIMKQPPNNQHKPVKKAGVGSRTRFRAAVDAVRVLSSEHRNYLSRQAVQTSHHQPALPHQGSGDKGSTWASTRVNSAYIKAVYVSSFTQGAEEAQRRRKEQELQQQQQQQQQRRSPSPVAKGPVCSWPKSSLHHQHDQDAAQLPPPLVRGASCAWPKTAHLGQTPTFKKMPSSNRPAPEHSRHSSPSPNEPVSHSNENGRSRHSSPTPGRALEGLSIQPLSRRLSTASGLSRHAGLDFPAGARRPATVDPTALQALRRGVSGVPTHAQKPTSQGAKLVTKLAKAFAAGGKRSSAYMDLITPASPSAKTAQDRLDLAANDAELQHQITPEERWSAAVSAADVDQLDESEAAAHHTQLHISDASQDSHTCLTANSMLAFVQGDLTTSNESSPTQSPRRPSRAVDQIPDLKARCAVPALASPEITPRLVVRSQDLGIARFGVPSISAQEDVAHTKERVNGLTERLAAQARSKSLGDGIHRVNGGTELLQQVSSAAVSVPLWKQHLFREKDLFDAVEQSKAESLANNPMCHPLLTAVESVNVCKPE